MDTDTGTAAAPLAPRGARGWLGKLGPGLITGAADDDPSGIATYSQAGAQFGYGMLWTLLLTYPLMVGIQAISAQIGRVSGHGLATNIRRHYPAWLLYTLVGLLLLANTINIAADIAAMGEAASLVMGGGAHWYAAGAGVLSALLQVMLPYQRYVRVLKWLTLALLDRSDPGAVLERSGEWRDRGAGDGGGHAAGHAAFGDGRAGDFTPAAHAGLALHRRHGAGSGGDVCHAGVSWRHCHRRYDG